MARSHRITGVVRRMVLLLVVLVTALMGADSVPAAGWLPHSLSFPTGVTQEELLGVGCASSTSCTAGGQDYNGSWGAHAEYGSGATWTFQSGVTRNPGSWANSVLNGSSCVLTATRTTFCMTVGSQGTSGGTPASMAQAKNGTPWTFYNTGVPAGATQSGFNAVSCVSSTWCMAVGWKMVSGDDKPFAMTFNGSTWSDARATTAGNATLLGVSCPSTTACVAVGSTGGSALAEVWSGSSWTITSAVSTPPNGRNYALRGVSCTSARWCLAVGSDQVSASSDSAFSSTWDGTTWSAGQNMPFSGTTARAYGISCVSTAICHGVGDSSGQPLADIWNGTYWLSETATVPSGATGGTLHGIVCTSSVDCEASGWSLFGGTPTGLIETYS